MSKGTFGTPRNMRVEELRELYDGILEEVDSALKEARISNTILVPAMPPELDGIIIQGVNGDPFPPDDLTPHPLSTIGQLFSYFQNYANYVGAEETRAHETYDIEAKRLKIVISALRLWYANDRGVEKAMLDDYVNTDERYVSLDAALEKIRAYYKFCESRLAQLKRTLNAISREQTRRAEEMEREAQANAVRGGSGPRRFS